MLKRQSELLLLTPEDVPPSSDQMKVVGVFNPGAIDLGDEVLILARVAEAPVENRPGFVGLPHWRADGSGIEIQWLRTEELTPIDPRVVERKRDGVTRLTFTSHLCLFRFSRDLKQRTAQVQRLTPQSPYETFGVEDPRITLIEGVYYITYVAVSEHGACTALARTLDFVKYERMGIIFPPENKDVTLFPEKIGGKYVALHRPNPRTHFSPPEMWLATSENLRDWGQHRPLYSGASSRWQTGRIGGGCPPVRVAGGWLVVYHGNDKIPGSPLEDVGVYSGGALLLAAEDPAQVIARSPEPIMVPEAEFERRGFVPNVVFPTALLDRTENWLVIYGAADSAIAAVELSKAEVEAILSPE